MEQGQSAKMEDEIMTKEQIMELVETEDVEFIRLQFTDMFGNLKNMAVTSHQLEAVLSNRCRFDGQALYGDKAEGLDDMYLVPDLDSFVILPWRPQQGKVARFICDIYNEDGSICVNSPRAILKKVLKEAKEEGYTIYVDPECEFFLFHADENGIPSTLTHDRAGYMDVGPVDLGENARRDMVLALDEMGFEIESSHHEKAPAQHEIDFKEQEALACADSVVTFRSAVRSIAKRFGLHGTFMPKPREGVAGSGMHMNISVYKDNKNIFNNRESKEPTEEAKWFIGGIMAHINALCAVTNPLVNSYKRLSSGFEAPKYNIWSTRNENGVARIRSAFGEDTKVELRFPDSAANPYLSIAACVKAGLEGIKNHTCPGVFAPDCYREEEGLPKLPITLIEAVSFFEEDELVSELFGPEFVGLYVDEKTEEWEGFMQHVSNWEIHEYLNRM